LRETLPEVVVVNPDMFVRERHLVAVRDAHLKAIEDKERAEARMFRGRGDRALICDGCLMGRHVACSPERCGCICHEPDRA
jgi:hypothetical protein